MPPSSTLWLAGSIVSMNGAEGIRLDGYYANVYSNFRITLSMALEASDGPSGHYFDTTNRRIYPMEPSHALSA